MSVLTRFFCLFAVLCLFGVASPVMAQDNMPETAPEEDWLEEEQEGMIDYPVVRLRALDKITARTMTFNARVGNTVRFGSIYIKIQACRKSPPLEQPESASFLQVWEVTPQGVSQWVFSGWMFASSPALSAMDHAVYDVWVIDCLEEDKAEDEGEDEAPEPEEQMSE